MKKDNGKMLWLWVGAAFALMFLAWTALFMVAARTEVADVPVVTKGVR